WGCVPAGLAVADGGAGGDPHAGRAGGRPGRAVLAALALGDGVDRGCRGCGERGGCGLVGAWFGAAEVAGLGADGTRRAGGRAALRGHRVGAGTVAVAVDGVAADRTTGACRRTRAGHGDGYAYWYGDGHGYGYGYGHRQFWRAAFPRGSAPGPGAAAV